MQPVQLFWNNIQWHGGNTYNVSTPQNNLKPFLSNVVYLGGKDTMISEVGFLFPILIQRACIAFITRKVCIPSTPPDSPQRTIWLGHLLVSALASGGAPRFPRTRILALPHSSEGAARRSESQEKAGSVRPPMPPGKRSVCTGGLVRGSRGKSGHTPGSA